MPDDNRQSNRVLVQGVDYYIENGFWVFTPAFHLQRGYCCKSGCRHCPYRQQDTTSKPLGGKDNLNGTDQKG